MDRVRNTFGAPMTRLSARPSTRRGCVTFEWQISDSPWALLTVASRYIFQARHPDTMGCEDSVHVEWVMDYVHTTPRDRISSFAEIPHGEQITHLGRRVEAPRSDFRWKSAEEYQADFDRMFARFLAPHLPYLHLV